MEASGELKRFIARHFERTDETFGKENKVFRSKILQPGATHRDIVNVLQDAGWDLLRATQVARAIPKWFPDRLEFIEELIGSGWGEVNA